MTVTESRQPRLTPKGLATRAAIVEAAAKLIYRNGVQGTSNEDVRKAAGVSGSQLGHYFPDKESLIRAVIAWRADRVIAISKIPGLGRLDSIAAIRLWADSYLDREEVCRGGCSFGSIASELLKTDMDIRDDVADGFERWEDVFRQGLTLMRDRGELRPDADPATLAYALMAAFQGGMLLTQASREVAPLRAALDGAIALVSSYLVKSPDAAS